MEKIFENIYNESKETKCYSLGLLIGSVAYAIPLGKIRDFDVLRALEDYLFNQKVEFTGISEEYPDIESMGQRVAKGNAASTKRWADKYTNRIISKGKQEESEAKFLGVEYGTEFKGKMYGTLESTGIYIPGKSKIEGDTVYLFTKFMSRFNSQPFPISTLTKTGKVYTKDEIDNMLPPEE